MAIENVCWEDDENNRRVDLQVEFDLNEGQLEVHCVTPNGITFVDASNGEVVRRLGIHTEKGRAIVVRQFLQAGGMELLQSQLGKELVASN